MPQPPVYAPQTNFSESAGSAGRDLIALPAVDDEFARIAQSIGALIENLGLLQNDDGTLKDDILTHEAMAAIAALAPPGPQGPQGIQGPQGVQGVQGPQGIQGTQGDQGVQGVQGAQGDSFEPDATVLAVADRAAYDDMPIGFAVLALDVGMIYFRNAAASGSWTAGTSWGQGPQGPAGPQGPQGIQGPAGPEGGTTNGTISPQKLTTGHPTWDSSGHLAIADPSTSAHAATKAYVDARLPAGIIVKWSGAVDAIPTGWALCNGANGTPDLRNRFIVGAGLAYAKGDTGGATAVALTTAQAPAHTHSVSLSTSSAGQHGHTGATSSDGAHTHTLNAGASPTSGFVTAVDQRSDFASANGVLTTSTANSAGAHSHTVGVNTAGLHTHTVAGQTAVQGSGASHENRPPYYALAYIMLL